MQLIDVAAASAEVGATSSRLAKIARIADLLRRAGTEDDPRLVAVVVSWLSGELPQRQIGVGWAALRSLPSPADEPTLTVLRVDAAFSEIGQVAGKGSQARRAELVNGVFAAATETEQTFLRRLLGGELRQGALVGVMADAVAKAADIAAPVVRRAAMLGGDLPAVAAAALTGGEAALDQFTLKVGQPVGPMLAQTATGVSEALERLGGTAVFEAKLDGARVQIHRAGDAVSIYTRSLDDVTERLPEVVEATLALPVTDLIADAEAIALRPDGRPHRFQVTASRFGRGRVGADRSVDIADRPGIAAAVGVRVRPAASGWRRPAGPADQRAGSRPGRHRADGPSGGPIDHRRRRRRAAVSRRHTRRRSRRGDGEVADRAVRGGPPRRGLAEGQASAHPRLGRARRRVGLGSSYRQVVQHPPRRVEPGDGRIRHAGKDFQGDDGRDAGLADHPLHGIGRRPDRRLCGETAARAGGRDRVRRSAGLVALPGRMALRFARVLRYRDDKSPAEADTIDTVRAIYERSS